MPTAGCRCAAQAKRSVSAQEDNHCIIRAFGSTSANGAAEVHGATLVLRRGHSVQLGPPVRSNPAQEGCCVVIFHGIELQGRERTSGEQRYVRLLERQAGSAGSGSAAIQQVTPEILWACCCSQLVLRDALCLQGCTSVPQWIQEAYHSI